MNVAGTQVDGNKMNVLPLFGRVDSTIADPIQELLDEANLAQDEEIEVSPVAPVKRSSVTLSQFPDQSMYVLDEQLNELKDRLNRIKFYLGDLDALIPNKKI